MSDPLNPNDDVVLIQTSNPDIKLEFDIRKKQFVGAWDHNHYKTPCEFKREIYLAIAEKYKHVDGMEKIG